MDNRRHYIPPTVLLHTQCMHNRTQNLCLCSTKMCLVMCLGQAIEQSGKKERPVADLHPSATHTLGMLNIPPPTHNWMQKPEKRLHLSPTFLNYVACAHTTVSHTWVSLLVSHSPNQQRLISKSCKLKRKSTKYIGLDRGPSESEIILDPR